MCAAKFRFSSYKLVQLGIDTSKTVILDQDDGIESPNTVILEYEEAARAASGGCPRRSSSPFSDMATYGKAQLPSVPVAAYDAARYQDATYDQYSAQSFSAQQTEKFAQLNQQSFASNHAVAQYMPAGPTLVSCHPMSGAFGTKILIKISSQYDLVSMPSAMPYFSVYFGSEKIPVHDMARESQDSTGFVYTCSVDAPQLMVTGCSGNSVPVSLVAEGPSGEEMSRMSAGSFQYSDGPGDDMTRTSKLLKHETTAAGPQIDQASVSPKTVATNLQHDAATTSYDYPSQHGQYTGAFAPGGSGMITTYRSSSFTEPHSYRRPPPSWSGYGGPFGGSRSSLDHSALSSGRPSLTPLPMPSPGSSDTPQLIRTSTMAGGGASNGSYHPISLYSSKAVLKINGKLDSMAQNWTQAEWDNRRRIVMFRKTQTGSTLIASFRSVDVNDRPHNSTCISCIWWAEKEECYVTSVDTILLLEQLVAAPNRFTVEEKNRIRRNLEGFHPVTVSKAKPDSEDFFKTIMGFPNPKPRNIEKDVKVFPWKILESALKKIIGKYSASPSASAYPPSSLMNPASGAPFAPLSTPPGGHHAMSSQQSLPPQQGDGHGQYSAHSSHHDPMPSPRSLSGPQHTWTPYTASTAYASTARALSPTGRHPGSHQAQHAPPMRINTNALPAVTAYDSRTAPTAGYGSGGPHTPIGQHPSSSSTGTASRWESQSAGAYPDSYTTSLTSHHPPGSSVYSAGGYGEGTSRA